MRALSPLRVRMFLGALALLLGTALPALAAEAVAEPPPATSRTFTVCTVAKATAALPAVPANQILHAVTGDIFEGAPDTPIGEWLLTSADHPFVLAAHLAFSDHRQLALSPDMIWLLINHMAVREVLSDPERCRAIFSEHQEGQRTLVVQRNDFVTGSPANDWPGVFAEFEKKIIDQAHDPLPQLFSHPFSSSSPAEIAARRATLLRAASPFFKFEVQTRCGIPAFRLEGSSADWRWIQEHFQDFAKLGMAHRVQALRPILEQFVAAADGRIDQQFWRNFYKFNSESGGSYITGWINLFFINEKAAEAAVTIDWTASFIVKDKHEDPRRTREEIPVPFSEKGYPAGYVEQDFIWKYYNSSLPMMLRAGFLGISQDHEDLTLRPQISWQVIRVVEPEEQRTVRRFLGGIANHIDFSGINEAISFDPERKVLYIAKSKRPKGQPRSDLTVQAWLLIVPMLNSLPQLALNNIYWVGDKDREEDRKELLSNEEFYRKLLALPVLKEIIYPPDLDPKCLAILADRHDWKLIPRR